eukprot:592130-Prymnesium_polylepis.1
MAGSLPPPRLVDARILGGFVPPMQPFSSSKNGPATLAHTNTTLEYTGVLYTVLYSKCVYKRINPYSAPYKARYSALYT